MANPLRGNISAYIAIALTILAVLFAFFYRDDGMAGNVVLSILFLVSAMVVNFMPSSNKLTKVSEDVSEVKVRLAGVETKAQEALDYAIRAGVKASEASSKIGLKSIAEGLTGQQR